ncbi:unnamed protein product [Macrosiphum euphorbiae]|uniref:Uncharacterized protein n=1 Tax=Macrosiphum euphorbiae TaxID=13131 RepID=A0AAV0YC61_9HEMI|nr:unnamed protein product [Macrosiphum euphorbiae]
MRKAASQNASRIRRPVIQAPSSTTNERTEETEGKLNKPKHRQATDQRGQTSPPPDNNSRRRTLEDERKAAPHRRTRTPNHLIRNCPTAAGAPRGISRTPTARLVTVRAIAIESERGRAQRQEAPQTARLAEGRDNRKTGRRKTGKPSPARRELQYNGRRIARHETRGRLANKPGREDHERDFKTGGQQSRVEKSKNANSGP